MAEDGYLLHILGERLANSREWPDWSTDSEFRATREKSAAERSAAAPAPAAMPVPAASAHKGERG